MNSSKILLIQNKKSQHYSLRNATELANAGMVPYRVAKCQQVATVLLSNHLVAAGEVEHLEGFTAGVGVHQGRVL